MDEIKVRVLILQSDAGDRIAYRELLLWLDKHARTFVSRGLSPYRNFPKELCGDIVQEVLIAFHETHQTFDRDRPVLPWINAIIRHKMIDFLRKKDFRVLMNGVDWETLTETLEGNSFIDPVEVSEANAALASLSEKDAEFIRLAKIEGLSTEEMSKKLGLSESNVKVSLHRAMKALREIVSRK